VGGALADGTVLQPSAQLLDGTTSLTRATLLTEVRATVPLRLTAVANPDPVVQSGIISYQYKLTNTSASPLTNVVLTEQTLNAGFAYVNESTGGAACNGAGSCAPGIILTWPAFTLAAGQTQTLWMTSVVSSGTLSGTLIHNHALLTYTGGTVANALDVTVDNSAKLHLGMTDNHNPAHPGDALTYTLTLANTGTQALPLSTAGVLSATVPVGTTFASATGGGTSANGIVSWNVGSVNPGAAQHYTFTVTVGSTLADGTVLESKARMLDGTTSLARATTSTEVKATTPLTLQVTVTPDPVAPAGLITYTLVITNTSASTLTNVILIDSTRNAATTLIADSTGAPTCNGAGSCGPGIIVTWPAFTLTAGQQQTVTMTSQVASGTPNGTIIHNEATLSYVGGSIVKETDVTSHL
jgi:uncharacterized repeat protein (TIGR01451 family)